MNFLSVPEASLHFATIERIVNILRKGKAKVYFLVYQSQGDTCGTWAKLENKWKCQKTML
uniref:Thioredoxin domain-containing protein 17 n=1 Tax=Heterorhabditis bacteriophora TaxID=37862 RepID=A0A1I7WDQ4_HETBA